MSLCACGCGQPAPIAKRTRRDKGHVRGQPVQYILGHNTPAKSPVEYVAEDRGHDTPCWVWQRTINHCGYGMLNDAGKTRTAHRTYYERANGEVPHGLDLDHLCGVRACVNPDHLEPVTHHENVIRGWQRRCTDAVGLRAARLSAGLSQRQLGALVGVKQTTISLWERRL